MTFDSEILADSPSVYYKFTEASGSTVTDYSGNAQHGTIVGAPTKSTSTALDTGYTFALGDYVTMPEQAAAGAFTAEFVLSASALGTLATQGGILGALIGDRDEFNDSNSNIIIASDYTCIEYSDSPAWIGPNPTSLVLDTYYHIVVTRDATFDYRTYINGELIGASGPKNNYIWKSHRLCNLKRFGTEHHFEGVLDQFAFYPSELSASRIQQHFNATGLIPKISIGLEITVEAETGIVHIGLEQSVYEVGSISIALEQTVAENTGTISISLEQSVYAVGSLSVALSQSVYDTTATPSPSWSLTVTVGGSDLTSVLTGRVEISASEQEAKLASFTIKPAFGSIDIYDWVNKRVLIDYTNGATTRLYTGLVDRPVYDPNTGLTTFYCTDAMQNTFNNLNNEQIDSLLGGYHSKHIFTGDARGWDYAKEHLSTLTKAFDLDANNTGRLTDWAAKATPDFTFTESDILDKSLRVDLAKRDKVHNTHNITFQYRFQRLRERVRSYTWVYPLGFPTWLTQSTTLPTKTMIRESVDSAGWTMASESYINPPKSAAVSLGFGTTIYWNIAEDIRQELLFSALFSMKKRWVQTVTEEYAINLFANQSLQKLGEIKQASQFSISSNEDTEGWVDYSVTPAGVSSVTANNDAVIDVTSGEVSRTDADNAVTTIQARAKAELLQSHRQNEVRYSTLLNPYIDRTHTAQVSTTPVTAKGKVKAYKHEFNLLSGSAITEIALALSKSQATGIPTATPIAPPVEADKTDPIAADPAHVVLDTHIGGQQSSPAFDDAWTGFLGNNALTAKKTFKNKSADPGSPAERDQEFSNVYPGSAVYPYAFRVPAPAIETLLTDSHEAKSAHTVEVPIPEDTLILAA